MILLYLPIGLDEQYDVIEIKIENDDIKPNITRNLKSEFLLILNACKRRVRYIIEICDSEVTNLQREYDERCKNSDEY